MKGIFQKYVNIFSFILQLATYFESTALIALN